MVIAAAMHAQKASVFSFNVTGVPDETCFIGLAKSEPDEANYVIPPFVKNM